MWYILHCKFEISLETKKNEENYNAEKNIKKNRRKKRSKVRKRKKEKRAQRKMCHKKCILIWFDPMTTSFGFHAANHFTMDTHKSLAWLSIYVSPMHFSIRIQTVYPLKSSTCLDKAKCQGSMLALSIHTYVSYFHGSYFIKKTKTVENINICTQHDIVPICGNSITSSYI